MNPVHFAELVRSRRTVKTFSGAALSRDRVDALLDLARWAPTHRLHQPWRFTVLDQAAITTLADFLRASPQIAAWPDASKGPGKLAKLLGRLPSLGALVQVTWIRHADPVIDLEDHAAASAAVQNILLGATADGIASYWSSSAALRHVDTLRWFGIDPDKESFLGSLWLGLSDDMPPVPPRLALDAVRTWR
jgi:nitroreductase